MSGVSAVPLIILVYYSSDVVGVRPPSTPKQGREFVNQMFTILGHCYHFIRS